MSYIQGTRVRLQADFKDNETGDPTDPTEVILTIEPPVGPAIQETLSGGQVINDAGVVGRFHYVLDTSAAPGAWAYQFESTGNEAVVGRKVITVKPRLTFVP
jgi:hypothetical protein